MTVARSVASLNDTVASLNDTVASLNDTVASLNDTACIDPATLTNAYETANECSETKLMENIGFWPRD